MRHPKTERFPRGAGRPRDDERIADRLAVWKRGCRQGLSVDQIAAGIGIGRDALDRMLVRERGRGNPDAVHHPAYRPPGDNVGNGAAARLQRRRHAGSRAI